MDINIDQGSQQGDLGRLDNGKYLYKFDNGKFDIDKFNRDFDQYKDKRKEEEKEILDRKLAELNKPPDITPPYNLSVGQIMINMTESTFNTIDDILNFNISQDTLLKQNRLFYLGILLIIVALILYAYMMFMYNDESHIDSQININIADKI